MCDFDQAQCLLLLNNGYTCHELNLMNRTSSEPNFVLRYVLERVSTSIWILSLPTLVFQIERLIDNRELNSLFLSMTKMI